MRAHAVLSASGAEKWYNCPPSARLEEELPDTSSDYAKEGTLAHSVSELVIRYSLMGLAKRTYTAQLKKLQADPLYQAEMLEHAESFAAYVAAEYHEAKTRTPDAAIELEQQLNMSRYIPEGFGKCDVVIAADDILRIIDYKYGKGVPVSAPGNLQLKLYALGALLVYGLLYNIRTVKKTIFQPRLDSISEAEIAVDELLGWAENELKPRAELAFAGEGEYCPGHYCTTHFCKAANTCRARAEKNLELAKYDFADPPLLSDDEIAEILLTAKELKTWAEDIWDYAQEEAVKGKAWPNFKLVEGRSNRVYTQREEILKLLVDEGFEPDKVAPRTLLGVTDMEKTLTKKRFNELLSESGYILKPAGKPTLTPMADPRPELQSVATAAEDFNDDFVHEENI